MSEVSVKIGNCTTCTGCGLCGKKDKTDIVVNSSGAPALGGDPESVAIHKSVVAIDLGTTTIAMYRLDAKTGEQLGVFVSLNPQQIHGADVLSRICAASNGEGKQLQQLITDTIARGVEKVSKEPPEFIVVAGNTVMQYLLLGYDPTPLGTYPFNADKRGKAKIQISGIDTIVLPGLSAFVGGDIVAGMYTLGFTDCEDLSLLIDLGTNGEMVLGNKDKILTASAAAGPAFDNKIHGTQLIAAVAGLLKVGKMDSTGCLADAYFDTGVRVGNQLIIQNDIRSLQQAKSAIRAGIEVLLTEYGCEAADVKHVYLAGGFGYYLDTESAFTIGMFPEAFRDCLQIAGNTSLEGAYRYAMDCIHHPADAQSKLSAVEAMAQNISLAENTIFSKKFIEYMSF